MANSADPDQLASSEANWSGSTLFAKAGLGLKGLYTLSGHSAILYKRGTLPDFLLTLLLKNGPLWRGENSFHLDEAKNWELPPLNMYFSLPWNEKSVSEK